MISVIVPVLNEEHALGRMLDSVRGSRGECEIIVVDGGSTDATCAIAKRYGSVISASPGRANQMNCGAAVARGDILLFLHADVAFPPDGFIAIEAALADTRMSGGNFDIVYEGASFINRAFTLINRWRRPFGIFYGDSGIFIRHAAFESLGGYRPLPLMEDYDLARRLVRRARTICLKQSLVVSARRWEKFGLLRTTAAWFFLHVFYYLGVPARWWSKLYPSIRHASEDAQSAADPAEAEPGR
jgi:rSAM/selenodomain-associated transferase 2